MYAACQTHRPGVTQGTANLSDQKTAIFPETRQGNVDTCNEFARGWSLREGNVSVSTKGAPHDGQDTESFVQHHMMGKTQKDAQKDAQSILPRIISYKRACIRNQCDNFLSLKV